MIELNIDVTEVIDGYTEFKEYINDEFNKGLMLRAIDNTIIGKSWPRSYFELRSSILPAILGDKASKFLFWFIFGGDDSTEIDYEEEDLPLLNFLRSNYTDKFLKAKQFNVNPHGFYQINYTHGADKDRFNIYITRNDDEQLLLRTSVVEYCGMLSQFIEYFSKMTNAGAIEISAEEETFLKMISSDLKETFNRLENRFYEGDNNE
ncbi:hypothetical protein [Halalkalibacter krulwichiae]|uniref:Uncharacterized protein n=1 Tax=Halalkalibacter krulwichiae TaxID=199441 RepID=A0A1X9MF79_9BACI|nr:hypothetical protein [Halalkalibacter krulwichiae]ARK32109.1 hypothetical protein BkAM31D_20945 [Halalkalibacter krulwichiae]